MEIDDIHKYVSLTTVGNKVAVAIAGFPALAISGSESSGYGWAASPVLAKLTTGSIDNTPYCYSAFDTVEEAVADGLAALHAIGVMRNEIDLDYAQGEQSVMAECRQIARSELVNPTLMELHNFSSKMFEEVMNEMAGPASKHDLGSTIDKANTNVAHGLKPHHGMDASEHAVLARSIIRAKAHEKEHGENPTPPAPKYKGAEHHAALLHLGGYEHKKGRPSGATVAARIEKEKERTKKSLETKTSMGVWGGLLR